MTETTIPANVTRFRRLTDEMVETYKRKNHDYGDSFTLSVNEWGPVAGLVRIQDKFNRAKTLLKADSNVQVDDETVADTLTDMAAYCLMLRMTLQSERKPLEPKTISPF